MDSEVRKIDGAKTLDVGESRLEVFVHHATGGAIIINYPGLGESIDGYEERYCKLADLIVSNQLGAVIRVPGKHRTEESGEEYSENLRLRVKSVIEYALDNAVGICGTESPHLRLMGFSAGASGAATIAHKYPAVDKVLLRAPSGDAGPHFMFKGLAKFAGEVYIITGENDHLGRVGGEFLYHQATSARKRQFVIIPNCDHWFKGEKNWSILRRTLFWAFGGDETFPSAEEGRVVMKSAR